MTVATAQPPESPTPHRFTREEYYLMSDAGLFQDRRVELIDGEIIDMAAMKDLHAAGILLAQQALQRAFPDMLVRPQLPLEIGKDSEPEPDVSVVTGTVRDYVGTGHPRSALLVVEVADATLRFDRGKKAILYAHAGIQDYWIVNLIDRCVEVRRNPVADETQVIRYQTVLTLYPPESVSPLANPQAKIAVADLLP